MSEERVVDDGGPAFPVHCDYSSGKPRGIQTGSLTGWAEGMTLRDWFAGMALQGDLSYGETPTDATIKRAYLAADKMIAERAKR